MQGLMMDYPLTLTPLLDRARRLFPRKEVITKAGPGTLYEAVATYLPVVVNWYIPGQENDNAAFFAEAGVALVSPPV